MRQRLRVWIENLETFVLEVIFEERRDWKARLMRGFLFGCSKLFALGVKFRRWLYNVRLIRDATLGVQVIAIGNLTVGGTGKTPVVEKFARAPRPSECRRSGTCTADSVSPRYRPRDGTISS